VPLISANTLFHFTSSLENLASILQNDFYPKYCIEDWSAISHGSEIIPSEIALPLICFCDIPLSSIQEHSKQYGEYAIGMSKNWGIRNGLSPVLYIHSTSDSSKLMFRIRKKINLLINKQNEIDNIFYDIVDLMKYTKPYRGKLWRKDRYQENVLFYNEREWRYSPATKIRRNRIEHDKEFRVSLYSTEYTDPAIIHERDERIKDFKLSFTIEDIRYIIISKETERLKAINMIQEIKGEKFSDNQVSSLISKLLLMEQVFDDF
jgi:abortive phage resistance protein AbiGi (putative antitoxin)